MDDQKSNVIYLQNLKSSDLGKDNKSLKDSKNSQRVNLAIEACKKSGNFTLVPNCLFEMGLSWQEREIWMYFNRIEPWEHPSVESIHKTLGMGKAPALAAIIRLVELGLLVVDGEGRKRKFHISHPIYWQHDIPRIRYAVGPADEDPLDLSLVFFGVVANRSKQNVPNRTDANRSKRNGKRSKRNEKTVRSVPNRTEETPETGSGSDVEGCCKTSFQDLVRLSLNPTDIGQMNLPGDEGGNSVEPVEERKITLAELEGSMLSLYGRYTQPKVISALIRTMLRKRSAAEILDLVEEQRRSQDQLLEWSHHHTDIWLRKLEAFKQRD